MLHRTFSGRPKTGTITGFSSVEIQRQPDNQGQPVPVITPQDVLNQIAKLQAQLKLDKYSDAIEALKTHVGDPNNPHRTNLHQFSEQVIDLLYEGYVNAGGEGSRDHFKECLFSVMRIATQAEMLNTQDPNLLISVVGARQFIDSHEADVNAHEYMIRHMFPGEEIYDDPAYAIYAEYGISKLLCIPKTNIFEEEQVALYSYIGSDFKLHYCTDRRDLPRDYSYGRPMLPCFGKRINLIPESNNFEVCKQANVILTPDAQVAPDGTNTATAVATPMEDTPKEHNVSISRVFVPINTTKVFSVFAKAESCKHFQISFLDMFDTRITVRAIFDLIHQRCLLMNHLNRYKAEIIPLNDGWSRCVFMMNHPLGQETDLHMAFFHQQTDQENMKFEGDGQIAGYLWGMQLEDGPSVSPYIPTAGVPVTRYPLPIQIELHNLIGDPSTVSWSIATTNPKKSNCGLPRPIFTAKQGKDVALSASVTTEGAIEILHNSKLQVDDTVHMAAVHQDIFPYQEDQYLKVAYGTSPSSVVSAVNDFVREADLTSAATFGDTLYLGTDGTHYLEGYLDHFILYGSSITKEQATFLNGDVL